MISSIVHADSAWDKDIKELTTSLALEQHSNIYNKSSNGVNASVRRLSVTNNLVSLYEGTALALPFYVEKLTYSNNKNLDNVSFTAKPALRLFLTPNIHFTTSLSYSQKSLLAGSDGAEFFSQQKQPLVAKQLNGLVALNIGQAPQRQFLTLSLNKTSSTIENALISSKNQSTKFDSTYGFAVSEDTYLQFNAGYAKQFKNNNDSQLGEIGAGFMTRFSGTHSVNVIIGAFQREDRINDSGLYWVMSDEWALSNDIQLRFQTSQRSVLGSSFKNTSQLTTRHQIQCRYKIDGNHHVALTISNQQSRVASSKYRQQNVGINWQWKIMQHLSMSSRLNLTKYHRQADILINSHQEQFSLSLRYAW
ncbi:MAG: hypothetical protein HRU25_06250 [Psychrobium sp.]|nr:hypothetical protein [Psychrobium sp.]